MTAETVTARVVRVVASVAPRWLTAKDVFEACPGENSSVLYATLSAQARDEKKGPLRKRRSEQGVLEYTSIEGFDLDAYLKSRGTRAARAPGPEKAALDEPEVQIVKALLSAKRRLTGDEIYQCGDYTSRESFNLRLAPLCKPGVGVLERERDEVGKPFRYGVRRDVDIEAWLKERGSKPDAAIELAPAEPKTAAPPAPAAEADSPDHISQPGKKVEPAPTVKDSSPVQQTAGGGEKSAAVPGPMPKSEPVRSATPAGPADRKHRAAPDLMTELAIIAAANLAAAVRDCEISGIPELESALSIFERADKLREEAKAERV